MFGFLTSNFFTKSLVFFDLKTKPEVIHAEVNCLCKLAASNESGKDAAIYITHAPCIECAKMIYASGIKEVFYKVEYRDKRGIEFLKECNLEVTKL